MGLVTAFKARVRVRFAGKVRRTGKRTLSPGAIMLAAPSFCSMDNSALD